MLGSYSSEIIWGADEMIENELRVTDAREIIFPHPTVRTVIIRIHMTENHLFIHFPPCCRLTAHAYILSYLKTSFKYFQ